MSARYESEEWFAWYRELTPTFAELTLAERGALVSVVMVLNPRTGEKVLRRGLASLPAILGDGVAWDELEPALARLIALRKLDWDGSNFVLRDPEYLARKRKTSAERTREWRERNKRDSGDVTNVTPSHVTQTRSDKTRQDKTREQTQISTAPPSASPTKRGTRLPDGWVPSEETQAWAKSQGVAEPTGQLLAEFGDYWRSVPGAKGVKLDWDATFRNRVRQVAQRSGSPRSYARGAEITKQPYDPDAPWMKLPEVS